MPVTRVLICSKCHLDPHTRETLPLPERDGGKLAQAVKLAVRQNGWHENVKVCTTKCLGCCDVDMRCGAVIETPGKDTQVLGGLAGAHGVTVLMAYLKLHLTQRRKIKPKLMLADPSWAKYFLIRIPAYFIRSEHHSDHQPDTDQA